MISYPLKYISTFLGESMENNRDSIKYIHIIFEKTTTIIFYLSPNATLKIIKFLKFNYLFIYQQHYFSK